MSADAIARGLSKAQRRAMQDVESMVSEGEAVLNSLIRLGLVAELSIPNAMDWNGPAFQAIRELGIDVVANYFTALGHEVRAIIAEQQP